MLVGMFQFIVYLLKSKTHNGDLKYMDKVSVLVMMIFVV